ncbi:hypothetical protein F2Q70_00028149 [Brassica cretica]|uniref:Uncharacterized protein n=2 Tax=Brassica cretica TaxID=69181 RepID=A0A8S9LE14_BRACR|nr:hypothetical protein F2Q68_00027721 [Brassica cretica]KAF2604281.1 hypothetical protein F2Q70_00028149 [Brassica cretica]KAF3577695.1 hypothetical protein DY000_02034846 [Brassica cretica]
MVVIISVNFYKTFILADCDQYFKKSLFFVGEIGGNDYNYPLLAFRSYKHAIDLVPSVINKIINVTSVSLDRGRCGDAGGSGKPSDRLFGGSVRAIQ